MTQDETPPAPGKPARGRMTAASATFGALRRDILTGRLRPGARLKVDALCKAHDASINPVREALNRLTAEGLVVLEDQRGFSVAPVSLEDWRDIVRGRCMVESAALTAAIANRTADWESGIVLSLHWLTRTPRLLQDRQPNPEWETRHHAFHEALLATCDARVVLAFCADLRDRSDRYRAIAAAAPQARQSHDAEHQEIAAAAIAGDSARAVALLVAHYRRTLAVVEDHFRQPD